VLKRMSALNLNQLLMIYVWFPLAVLLAIMLLVARFYQNLTGESTRYYLFGVPIVLFGLASAHYANIDQVIGDPTGDLLLFLGGTVLIILCVVLYRQMTTGR
jgi:Flp pilus assembly protein TadB